MLDFGIIFILKRGNIHARMASAFQNTYRFEISVLHDIKILSKWCFLIFTLTYKRILDKSNEVKINKDIYDLKYN